MTKQTMTRAEMQSETILLESLLSALMALLASDPTSQDRFALVEMAQSRAGRLNAALDIINAPEVAA